MPGVAVAVSIYGSSLVLMYFASTCYHCVRPPRIKRMLKILDHASIYLLIAGTYTPILLISIRGYWGWSLFGVIWGLAGTGVILKLFFVDRYEAASAALYVAMGWLVLVGAKPLFASIPGAGIVWLFAGGISYTGGVIFLFVGSSAGSTTPSGICSSWRGACAIFWRCCCTCCRWFADQCKELEPQMHTDEHR